MPRRNGEIGLGAEVARRLYVDVGSTVEVEGTIGAQRCTVVGIVVTLGSAGNGPAVAFPAFQAINPDATENVVLVDFGDEVRANVAAAAISDANPLGALTTPGSVRAMQRVTAAPLLLVVVLAVLLTVGGAYFAATAAGPGAGT